MNCGNVRQRLLFAAQAFPAFVGEAFLLGGRWPGVFYRESLPTAKDAVRGTSGAAMVDSRWHGSFCRKPLGNARKAGA
jgi:hypothetical protein